jgi:hypothetical protein
VREPSDGKIERAVLAIALGAATLMLVLAVAALGGLVIECNFRGEAVHDREAFHTALRPCGGGLQSSVLLTQRM